MGLINVRRRPELRRPILLAGFGGWGDAGSGATGALNYLVGDPEPEACAVYDPEATFDFTVQRPVTVRTSEGRWTLAYPEIRFHAIERPDHERDLLVLTGPEPHMYWPTLSKETATFAKDLGVEMVATLGVFLGSVSHRSVALVRRTLDPNLDRRLSALGCVDTGYQGPTGYVTSLTHACTDIGIPAAGIWAAAPMYLRAVNPSVALSLLETVEQAMDVTFDLDILRERSRTFISEVDSMLAANPELANQLSEMIDLGPQGSPETPEQGGSQELPSGQSLVEELEKFLREKRSDGPLG